MNDLQLYRVRPGCVVWQNGSACPAGTVIRLSAQQATDPEIGARVEVMIDPPAPTTAPSAPPKPQPALAPAPTPLSSDRGGQ